MSMLALCHSSYSLQAGVCSPSRWAEAARSRGYQAMALVDINGLYGAVNFYETMEAAGLHPIIGATLQFRMPFSFLVLVMNADGYSQLCRLLTRRHLYPDETPDELLKRQRISDLIFLTHTLPAWNLVAPLAPCENLYLLPAKQGGADRRGLRSPCLWDHVQIPSECRIAPVPDAWFIDDEDQAPFLYREQLRCMAGRGERFPLYAGAQLPDARTWCRRFSDAARVMDEITERCTFRFPFGRTLLPRVDCLDGPSAAEQLRTLCDNGRQRKYAGTQRNTEANKRMHQELKTIIENGFADYFLCVYDIITFAHAERIPVGVRGSAASSLVSYLLDFTYCCPLEHDLYFERFMNPGRTVCPDIDIDIADTRRDEVIAYCYRQWGESHVGMIANLQTYHRRSAFRDAARLLHLPVDKVQELLESGGPLPHEKRLRQVAASLQGLPRHLGLHCAGLVITPCPLTDVTPLCRSGKGVVMTHYEKEQLRKMGLVKIDLLGNSALSVIDESLYWIRQTKKEITLRTCTPRYDYKINRAFRKGDTLGVYQCESPGMRQLCRAVQPRTPKEVAATLSLIRPGPAASGMKEQFIRRRRHQERVAFLHPRMADFLRETYGVMLYQEDVMKVAVKLAAYTPGEADVLRRSLSKKDGEAPVEDAQTTFIADKAVQAGLSPQTAEAVWKQVSRFASYAYCKAHATVYGRLAWITAFLKTHYAEAFVAATLNCHKSMYPKRVFVWDAIRHGIPVRPPDVCRSHTGWTATGGGVRAGLGLIKGIRRSTCARIVAERQRRSFDDFRDFRTRVSPRKDELIRCVIVGACRRFGRRSTLLHACEQDGYQAHQQALFDASGQRAFQLPALDSAELMLTGIPFAAHPVETPAAGVCPAADMHAHVGQNITMVGIMDALKITRTKGKTRNSRPMSFVTLEDASGMFELLLFPDVHAQYSHLFTHLGPYRVSGRVVMQWDSLSLEVAMVQSIA